MKNVLGKLAVKCKAVITTFIVLCLFIGYIVLEDMEE